MKLQYDVNSRDRLLASLVGTELVDKHICLNQSEVSTLKKAQEICNEAQEKLEGIHGLDYLIDTENDYMQAEIALCHILEEV